MFTKVLIANRGEIACRIIRTLKKMGIGSVAVYSDPDATAAHVLLADEAVRIGPAAPAESYLNMEAILCAARQTGAQAIHPGYGFLSENAALAGLCAENGIEFIGPTPEQLVDFGLKHKARELAERWNVPLVPGSGLLDSVEAAKTAAESIGYPVMLKSTAGASAARKMSWRRDLNGSAGSAGIISRIPVSLSKNTSNGRVMWRCRSLAMEKAESRFSVNVTAPCSGAIRK